MLLLIGQRQQAWERSKNNAVSVIGENWVEKYFYTGFKWLRPLAHSQCHFTSSLWFRFIMSPERHIRFVACPERYIRFIASPELYVRFTVSPERCIHFIVSPERYIRFIVSPEWFIHFIVSPELYVWFSLSAEQCVPVRFLTAVGFVGCLGTHLTFIYCTLCAPL